MHSVTPHRGRMLQRGNGLGGLFRSLGRTLVPLAKKAFTSEAARAAGRLARDEAIRLGTSTAADALAGENVGQALEKHAAQARKRAAAKIRQAGEEAANAPPSAKKPRSTKKKATSARKKKKKPLF